MRGPGAILNVRKLAAHFHNAPDLSRVDHEVIVDENVTEAGEPSHGVAESGLKNAAASEHDKDVLLFLRDFEVRPSENVIRNVETDLGGKLKASLGARMKVLVCQRLRKRASGVMLESSKQPVEAREAPVDDFSIQGPQVALLPPSSPGWEHVQRRTAGRRGSGRSSAP